MFVRAARSVIHVLRGACIFVLLLLYPIQSYADSVGSDLAVSVQSFYNFPASPIVPNDINSFVWMKNGFALADNTTACTFGSVFPASGLISLNGGTLYLTSDLILSEGATLQNLGKIASTSTRLVDLANTVTLIPNGSYVATFQNIEVGFDQDVTLAGTLHINGTVEIDGRSNTLTLSNNGYIIIDDNSQLTLYDLTLVGANANNVRCANAGGSLTLDNVRWYQDSNIFTFTQGSIEIQNQTEMVGSATFNYASSFTSTIAKNSIWKFSDGMLLQIGRQSSDLTKQPLYFEDPNSTLALERADMLVTASGMSLMHGKIQINSEATLDVANTQTTYGLILGDGTSDGDVAITFGSGTIATFNSGAVISKLINSNAFNSASNATQIIRNAASYFNLQQDFTFRNITAIIDPDSDIDTTYDKQLFFDNCRISFPTGLISITGRRIDPFTSLLNGNEEISVLRGNLAMDTRIAGTGNSFSGVGSVSGALTLSNSSAALDINFSGELNTNIDLNGGAITLGGNLSFMNDYCFTGSGIIDLDQYVLQLGSKDLMLSSSIYIDNNRSTIELNSKITLSSTVTFSGICTIDGNGNEMSFDTTGVIYVENGSTLKFKNIKLTDLGTSSLICLDNAGTIIFEDSTLLLNNHLTTSMGNVIIDGELDLVGTGTYTFASPGTITVRPTGTIYAHGITLELGRLTQTNQQPLVFQDGTSTLKLDNVFLHIINQGLQVTVGKIQYVNDITISMDSTNTTNGIILGDGTPANDVTLEFLAGSNSKFINGHMVFNITSPSNFISHSKTAQITRYAASNYYVNRTVNISNVTINTANGSTLTLAPGAALVYNGVTAIADDYTFDITGTRYNSYTNLLAGNQEIYITKGNLPAYTRIQSTGNAIRGIGNIDGLVYLVDSNTTLSFGFDGKISQAVLLNGGSVYLTRDLRLAYNAVFSGAGSVYLSNNQLRLGGLASSWTGTTYFSGNNGSIQLGANLQLSSTVTFSGSVSIDGTSHTLTINPTGHIVVEAGSTLTLRNISIDGLMGTNISCVNNQSKIILENVTCRFDNSFSLSTGSIRIQEKVDFNGTATFTYCSPQSMIIDESSSLNIENICLSLGRSTVGGSEPISFNANTSYLTLNNCALNVLSNGWLVTKGQIFCQNNLQISVNSTDTSNGLMVGDGTSAGDPQITYLPGATVTYEPGHYYYNFYNPNLLTSRSNITKVIRTNGSIFYFNSETIMENISIEAQPYIVTTVAPGSYLEYSNCTLIGNGYIFDITGRRLNFYSNLLNGNATLSLTKGTMPAYTFVQGTGNTLMGSGDLGGLLMLEDSGAQLTISLDGTIYQSIAMNGGSIAVDRDLIMANEAIFAGPGTLTLESAAVNFGYQSPSMTGTLFIDSSEGVFGLHSTTQLSATMTVSGFLTINGNGNRLSFQPGGNIAVAANATLSLKNLTLYGVAETNLRCIDDTGTIILENSNLILSNDYSFTTGALIIEDSCYLSGDYTFTLQSSIPATVETQSKLILQDGIALTLGRYGDISGSEPLIFTDATSELIYKRCTFNVLPTGFSMLRGRISVQEDALVIVNSTDLTEAFILGDGTADNDPTVAWLAGSRLNFLSGHIIYNAASPTQFQTFTKTSLLQVGAGTVFYVQADCVLQSVFLQSDPASVLAKAPDKSFTYRNCFFDVTGPQFNLTGKDYNPYTYLLDSDGEITLVHGAFPLYTVINGTNNAFRGNGDIAGLITLTNDAAELTFNIAGSILTNIEMNGGTLILESPLQLANDVCLNGSGSVALQGNIFNFGHQDVISTSTINWTGSSGSTVVINAQRTLTGNWTFSGNTILTGRGVGVLSLDETGQITVAPNTTLILKDLSITNLADTKILCADATSTIIFDNVYLELENDYTFSVGSFTVRNTLDLVGGHIFIYTSDQPSHILARSSICGCDGTSISYAPSSTANNLLVLEASSSIIQFMDSTLYITDTGLQLTNGQLIFRGSSAISGQSIDSALTLGNNSTEQDCILDLRMGVHITTNDAKIVYKNTDASSFMFDTSSLFDIGAGGGLALYYTLESATGLIRFADGTALQRTLNAILNTPIQILGSLNYEIIS